MCVHQKGSSQLCRPGCWLNCDVITFRAEVRITWSPCVGAAERCSGSNRDKRLSQAEVMTRNEFRVPNGIADKCDDAVKGFVAVNFICGCAVRPKIDGGEASLQPPPPPPSRRGAQRD